MKILFTILAFILLTGPVMASEEVKNDLIKTAQIVKQRRAIAAYNRELDNYAQREAIRLGFNSKDPRVAIIRRIILVFGDNSRYALAIAKCESGIVNKRSDQPNKNGTWDFGVLQINEIHKDKFKGKSMLDLDASLRVAKQIFEDSWWWPWTTFKNGCYGQYI